MKRVFFGCDTCKKEKEGSPLGILPAGYLEVSFYNQRWYRYCFCSYTCLTKWAEERETYYGKRYAENTEVTSAISP